MILGAVIVGTRELFILLGMGDQPTSTPCDFTSSCPAFHISTTLVCLCMYPSLRQLINPQISSNMNQLNVYCIVPKPFLQVQHKHEKGSASSLHQRIQLNLARTGSVLGPLPVKHRNLRAEEHVGETGPPKGHCPSLGDGLQAAVVGMQMCGAQSPVCCDREQWPDEVADDSRLQEWCPTLHKTITAIGNIWRPFCQAQQGEQEPKGAGRGDKWSTVPLGLGMLVAGCGCPQCHCPLQAAPPGQGVSPTTANQP